MKATILAAVGMVGGIIASLLGGWDAAAATLCMFMAADYVTGLIVAGVFHKSNNSTNGALESRAGFKGLCRKGGILLIVFIAAQLDLLLGETFIRDGVVTAFVANEAISIIENVGLMGVPIPPAIKKAIDVLNERENGTDSDKTE